MDRAILRKPRVDFDVAANPRHIAYDDAKEERRNILWLHYTQARWEYDDPDPIRIEIGECCVVIREAARRAGSRRCVMRNEQHVRDWSLRVGRDGRDDYDEHNERDQSHIAFPKGVLRRRVGIVPRLAVFATEVIAQRWVSARGNSRGTSLEVGIHKMREVDSFEPVSSGCRSVRMSCLEAEAGPLLVKLAPPAAVSSRRRPRASRARQ